MTRDHSRNGPLGLTAFSDDFAAQGPFRGVADVCFRGDPEPAGGDRANAFREDLGLIGPHEVNRTSGPTSRSLPPRNPGLASAASTRASRASELFSKSSRLDACEAETAVQTPLVAGFQGNSTLTNPLILAKHMPGTLAANGIEPVPVFRQLFKADVPQRLDGIAPAFSWKYFTIVSHSARRRLYMPSASRREVLESQTMIAGAGSPSGNRA